MRIIDFIVYAIKRIQKKFINKNKKYIFINYKNENIFYLYNLIKKIVQINNIYFIEKRSLFVNLKKLIETYNFINKKQRFMIVSIFVTKKNI